MTYYIPHSTMKIKNEEEEDNEVWVPKFDSQVQFLKFNKEINEL